MAPILFVDRDGTIIEEPQPDGRVDSFEKLSFLPGVIKALSQIHNELGYELVMVTNQDGLGSDSFPEEAFKGPHELMLRVLSGEGITFREVLIDSSYAEDKSPNRKPGTGLVEGYRTHPDLSRSFMVGDRESDMEFANNLGVKGLLLGSRSKLALRYFFGWSELGVFIGDRSISS